MWLLLRWQLHQQNRPARVLPLFRETEPARRLFSRKFRLMMAPHIHVRHWSKYTGADLLVGPRHPAWEAPEPASRLKAARRTTAVRLSRTSLLLALDGFAEEV